MIGYKADTYPFNLIWAVWYGVCKYDSNIAYIVMAACGSWDAPVEFIDTKTTNTSNGTSVDGVVRNVNYAAGTVSPSIPEYAF